MRDQQRIYRTYFHGIEALGNVWTFLDLTSEDEQQAAVVRSR